VSEEQVQSCQVEGCCGTWPRSENWSGRWECDEHLGHENRVSGVPGQPMMAGTFAIYEDPTDAGLVLVADVAGRGVTRRKVPGTLVRMLTGQGGGPLGAMMRKALGGE
jgi:hypothetical protein